VTVEGFYAREDLAVVPAGDQDLCSRPDGGLEDREWTSGKLVLFDLGDLIFTRRQLAFVELADRKTERFVRQLRTWLAKKLSMIY
jgi:hypothetical protein